MSDLTSIRVILVRHGRTPLNAAGQLRGLADPELDEVGVAQVAATAAALSTLGITRVLSSPLKRAVHTAAIIAEACGVGHETDAAFNDRDYGPWTGHLKSDVVKEWGSVDAAPGVEATAVVMARVRPALDDLAVGTDRGPIVVVSHDAVIRPLLLGIQPGIEPEVENGSWAELAHNDDGWTIVSFDNFAG
ncbi:MAG: histidine phosphatase family protein [Pseudolysinimonas sp.]